MHAALACVLFTFPNCRMSVLSRMRINKFPSLSIRLPRSDCHEAIVYKFSEKRKQQRRGFRFKQMKYLEQETFSLVYR